MRRAAQGAGRRAKPGERRAVRVALLGSTGSIGRQAADVISRYPERFEVVALAAGSNAQVLGEQVAQFHPAAVALGSGTEASIPNLPTQTKLIGGPTALEELATRPDVDLVVVATGGLVSLRPVIAALAAGKVVATANKETLVAGGHLVMPYARALAARRADVDDRDPFGSPLAWLRPIDSEHSAIWQCLVGEPMIGVAGLVLTASGGPFLERPETLDDVTPQQALRHPTWSMGAKITIDSATLANKGLEVIEAHWLYDVGYDAIEVVIHPQSVVHSAVRFVDGSLKAQLGTPDMRLPIQFALTYPDRWSSPAAPPDLAAAGRLDFRTPDEARFPSLRLARQAGLLGPWASAALIVADEVAVARFLARTLAFTGIPTLLEMAIERFGSRSGEPQVDELVDLEQEIRNDFATVRVGGAA